ncbi:hypothetical protein PR048_029098 [Dryococelus australis]|uniref:Uncharacterized protein n=1 Tax=Dryococelus australis TaxID=614101 RepID=A0ABQ9GF20_9NEOP|nr:hypothetical protein PR048_029098 [Dryococelus australis]
MLALEAMKQAPEVQSAILLTIIGEESLELYNTFEMSTEEKKDPAKVLKAFEKYCIPRANAAIKMTRESHMSKGSNKPIRQEWCGRDNSPELQGFHRQD